MGLEKHCALDLKWGGAETMAMKKTWRGCEKQPTSITLGGTVPKMVHEKVDVLHAVKHSRTTALNDSIESIDIYMSACTTSAAFTQALDSPQIAVLQRGDAHSGLLTLYN